MKLQDANLQVNEKKLFLTSSFMHFTFTFSEYSRLIFPKRLWKWASTISFRKYKRKVVLLVIYLFNYDSSKSTFFMLNMAFDVLFLTFWVQFLLYKLEFFVSCNSISTSTSFFLLCVSCKFYKKVIVLRHGDNSFLFYVDICNQINTLNNNFKDEEKITSQIL